MGHYASEMGYVSTSYDISAKARELGYLIGPGRVGEMWTCPTCFSLVSRSNLEKHHEWHKSIS